LKGKKEKITPIILSRPSSMEYDKEEVNSLLNNSQGIGISAISDWDYSNLEKLATSAKERGKMFAIHASEWMREDIDAILDLNPDFLVHMVRATDDDLEIVADSRVPVVVCPRSNAFFSLRPNIDLMIDHGIQLMLGTDNAMLVSPKILDEARYCYEHFRLPIEKIMEMISYEPRKCLNLDFDMEFVVDKWKVKWNSIEN
jgi:cytosine/adenosine deaminase-related metal-dependent hydrolase